MLEKFFTIMVRSFRVLSTVTLVTLVASFSPGHILPSPLPVVSALSAPQGSITRATAAPPKSFALHSSVAEVSNGGAANDNGASIPNEVFNLVKNIVGAGVLSLPAGVAAFGNHPSALLPAAGLTMFIGM